jgi:hypothetical protein
MSYIRPEAMYGWSKLLVKNVKQHSFVSRVRRLSNGVA